MFTSVAVGKDRRDSALFHYQQGGGGYSTDMTSRKLFGGSPNFCLLTQAIMISALSVLINFLPVTPQTDMT